MNVNESTVPTLYIHSCMDASNFYSGPLLVFHSAPSSTCEPCALREAWHAQGSLAMLILHHVHWITNELFCVWCFGVQSCLLSQQEAL